MSFIQSKFRSQHKERSKESVSSDTEFIQRLYGFKKSINGILEYKKNDGKRISFIKLLSLFQDHHALIMKNIAAIQNPTYQFRYISKSNIGKK